MLGGSAGYPPNRTILELKQDLHFVIPNLELTPNRTILELKQFMETETEKRVQPPNRTILELKPNPVEYYSPTDTSQSHHTGIETLHTAA